MTTTTIDPSRIRLTRTITMTGRPPVKIVEADWPVIASAEHEPGSFRNGTPVPRYEHDTYTLRVRANKDGRVIVYGVCDGATAWTGTESKKAGYLLDCEAATAAGIVNAIRTVARDLGLGVLGEPGATSDCSLAAECIADLPAEQI